MQEISPPSKQCLGETKYRYSREIKFLCAGPGHRSELQSWPPYQDMTLLSTLLGKPGFQQQLHLLGPQEPGDLTCGKTIYWVTLSSHQGHSVPKGCARLVARLFIYGSARKQWSGSLGAGPPEQNLWSGSLRR